MKPVWGRVATCENPDNVAFWDPKTRTLQAGIFESFVKPPATPSIKEYNM